MLNKELRELKGETRMIEEKFTDNREQFDTIVSIMNTEIRSIGVIIRSEIYNELESFHSKSASKFECLLDATSAKQEGINNSLNQELKTVRKEFKNLKERMSDIVIEQDSILKSTSKLERLLDVTSTKQDGINNSVNQEFKPVKKELETLKERMLEITTKQESTTNIENKLSHNKDEIQKLKSDLEKLRTSMSDTRIKLFDQSDS